MRLHSRREKVFGPGRAVPLDRNAKARIVIQALSPKIGPEHRTKMFQACAIDAISIPLERALAQFAQAFAAKNGLEEGTG